MSGPAEGDLALVDDLRAVTLMNMRAVQVRAGRTSEAERHLEKGVEVAREIGRPFLEVTCLAQLGYATKARSMVIATRICHEALATAERYGWGADWNVYPALITLAEVAIYTGEFDQGERWLARTTVALGADSGPAARTLLHRASGMFHAGRGEARSAAESFEAAERTMEQLTDSYANADQVTGGA